MRRMTAMIAVVAFLGLGVAGCEKGPMQKAGDKIDEITDQDKIIGKGIVLLWPPGRLDTL